jgi:hypothetical protein
MIFFPSSAVKIFPCSYRGIYDIQTEGDEASTKKLSKIFDPEARLTTEYNLTHLPGLAYGKDSYIISSEGNIWKFVINGYYFEINADLTDVGFEKFAIALHTSTFSSSQEDVRTTNRLVPLAVSTTNNHKLTVDKSGNIGLDKAEINGGLTTYKCLAVCAMTNQDDSNPDLTGIPQNIRFCYLNKADTLKNIETAMLSPINSRIDTVDSKVNNTKLELIGEDTDTAQASTIVGAKKYADEQTTALGLSLLAELNTGLGTKLDTTTYNDYIKDKTLSDEAITEYADDAAADAKAEVIGKSGDAKTADTIYGAKAFATAELAAAIGGASAPAVGEPGAEDYVPAVAASGIHVVIEKALQDAKDYADSQDTALETALETALIGTDNDAATADTIKGVKKYAEGLVAELAGQGEGDEGGDAPTITSLSLRVSGIDSRVSDLEDIVNGKTESTEGADDAVVGLKDRVKALEDVQAELVAEIGEASVPAEGEPGADNYREAVEATGIHKVIEEAVAGEAKAREDADKVITDRIGDVAEDKTVVGMIADVEAKIPTDNANLGNGAGYQTKSQVDAAISGFATVAYVDDEIDKVEQAIASLNHFKTEIVNSIDEVKAVGILYLIKDESAKGVDTYCEYIVVDGKPVLIGDTTTDLSNYYNKNQVYTKDETDEAIIDELGVKVGSAKSGETPATGLFAEVDAVQTTANEAKTAVATLESKVGKEASEEGGPTGLFKQLDSYYTKDQIERECGLYFDNSKGTLRLITPDYLSQLDSNTVLWHSKVFELETWLSNYLAKHLKIDNHWTLNLTTVGSTYLQKVEIYYLANYKTPTAEDVLGTEYKDDYKDYYYWRLTKGENQYDYCKAGAAIDLSEVPDEGEHDLDLGLYACSENGTREFILLPDSLEDGFELSEHDYSEGSCTKCGTTQGSSLELDNSGESLDPPVNPDNPNPGETTETEPGTDTSGTEESGTESE